jgi:hypothetical protein
MELVWVLMSARTAEFLFRKMTTSEWITLVGWIVLAVLAIGLMIKDWKRL